MPSHFLFLTRSHSFLLQLPFIYVHSSNCFLSSWCMDVIVMLWLRLQTSTSQMPVPWMYTCRRHLILTCSTPEVGFTGWMSWGSFCLHEAFNGKVAQPVGRYLGPDSLSPRSLFYTILLEGKFSVLIRCVFSCFLEARFSPRDFFPGYVTVCACT